MGHLQHTKLANPWINKACGILKSSWRKRGAFAQNTLLGVIGDGGGLEDGNIMISKRIERKMGKCGKWKEMAKRSEMGRMI